jgi:chemotaxis protein MotB
MSEQNLQPIIIKKKVSHGGHHGGAWKVAYAEFVPPMMALFIVLWLLSSSAEVKEAVSAYFNDPSGTGKQLGSSQAGAGESLSVNKDDMGNLKEKLEQALKQSPNFEKLKDNIQMSVTGDGLRIELLESESGMFFQSGSPAPSSTGKELIVKLAEELGQLPNDLLIEGHTDARPFGARADYTNWELSSDRANAARRLMEVNGLRAGQVVQVRGFADHNLRQPEDPNAATNRRVSVIVKYLNAPPVETTVASPKGDQAKVKEGGEHH